MATQIAGARFLDERRRRRLASEKEALPVLPTTSHPLASGTTQTQASQASSTSVSNLFPIQIVLPSQRWCLGLIALGVLFLIVLLILVPVGLENLSDRFKISERSRNQLAFCVQRIERGAIVFLFLLMSMMSLVIRYARSRSLTDFAGAYRKWTIIAAVWLIAGFFILSEMDLFLTELTTAFWFFNLPGKEYLCWLLPVLVWGLVLFVSLYFEFRVSKISTLFLFCSLLLFLTSSYSLFESESLFSVLSLKYLTPRTAFLMGCGALFFAHIYQTWFVLHVSCEPAPRKRKKKKDVAKVQSDQKLASENTSESITQDKRKNKSSTQSLPDSSTESNSNPASDKKPQTKAGLNSQEAASPPQMEGSSASSTKAKASNSSTSKRKGKKSKQSRSRSNATSSPVRNSGTDANAKEENNKSSELKPTEKVMGNAKKSAKGNQKQKSYKVHCEQSELPPPELLKGLSKRQRRKVKQKWRQEQKQAAQQTVKP